MFIDRWRAPSQATLGGLLVDLLRRFDIAAHDDERFWSLCCMQRAVRVIDDSALSTTLGARLCDGVVRRLSECNDEALRAALVLLTTLLERNAVARDVVLRAQTVVFEKIYRKFDMCFLLLFFL